MSEWQQKILQFPVRLLRALFPRFGHIATDRRRGGLRGHEVTTDHMPEYEVYREFDGGLSQDQLRGAVEACGDAIEECRAEGQQVGYLGSEVLLNEAGTIVGTMCCFDGESREQIEQLNERAGVPFVTTYRRGTPVEGAEPKAE